MVMIAVIFNSYVGLYQTSRRNVNSSQSSRKDLAKNFFFNCYTTRSIFSSSSQRSLSLAIRYHRRCSNSTVVTMKKHLAHHYVWRQQNERSREQRNDPILVGELLLKRRNYLLPRLNRENPPPQPTGENWSRDL